MTVNLESMPWIPAKQEGRHILVRDFPTKEKGLWPRLGV